MSQSRAAAVVVGRRAGCEPPQPAARNASNDERGRGAAHGRALTRAILPRCAIGRYEVRVSNPDKLFFPERGLTKGDLVRYYLDVADCALPHLRRRPFHMKRYPNGVDGDFFHQKRVPPHPDYVGEQFVAVPERALDRVRGRRQRRRARVGDQPRLHRAAHLALARRGDRAAGLPPDRPRPDLRRPVAVRARDRARRAGGDGRARPRVVPEDLRRDRSPHPRADQAGARVPGGAPLREGAGGGGRAARRRPGGRDDDVARRRPRAASSSTSARTRATGRSPPRTPCGRRRTRACRRRCAGTRSPTSSPPRSPSRRCATGSPRSATRWRACGGGGVAPAAVRAARPRARPSRAAPEPAGTGAYLPIKSGHATRCGSLASRRTDLRRRRQRRP